MTLTSILSDQESSLDLLATLIERHKQYVITFGYPSGKACPYCGKETYANVKTLEQLAASPNAALAHDWCVELAGLKAELAKLKAEPPTLHIVELPKPAQAGGGPPQEPGQQEPIPEPAPAPAPEPGEPEPAQEQAAC